MPKLTFVIGATASGKSYFIKQNYGDKDVDILNVFDYQQQAYDEAGFGKSIPIPMGARFRCLMKANQMLLFDIIAKLSQGRNLVAEQTFFKAKRRIAYMDQIRKLEDVTIEVYVMNPGDSLWESNIKKRNLEEKFERFKRDVSEMEFPNVAEGIDAIYEVVDGAVILRMDPPKPEILETAREELRQEAKRIHDEDEAQRKREELIESMNERPFWHYCEVCGKKEFITKNEAFESGWDYPPNMGQFGLLGPRKCGKCIIKDTLWWKVNKEQPFPIVIESALTPEELVTWKRIKEEPESLLVDE